MIDLHCHILPDVDDGAQTIQDSLDMGRKAVSQGITHILCTPHHHNGVYLNYAADIIRKVGELQEVFDDNQIEITLMEGQEVRLFGDLLPAINKGEILFTDLDNTYILIEFPSSEIPNYAEEVFYELLSRGKVPVIVHPERNAGFREDIARLEPFIEMGVLTQLTAPSIVGKFGKSIKKTAIDMMDRNLLHMVASDAHGINRRNFYLQEAYEEIGKRYGQEKVDEMMDITRNLVNGDPVDIPEIKKVKKSLSWF